MDILIPTVIGAIVGGLIGFAYDKYNQALAMQAECLAKEMKLGEAFDQHVLKWYLRPRVELGEVFNPEAGLDAYLDRIAEADDAYDSYVGDNHPAHEKQ